MTDTQELKTSLHALIDQSNDPRLLQVVHQLLTGDSGNFWDDLNDAQKAAIQAGLEDAESGRVVSWQDLKQRFF